MKKRRNETHRNKEIVSFRMKLGIKEELDGLCTELEISRSNFILNCVVKEICNCKGKKGAENKKKLLNVRMIDFYLPNINKNKKLKALPVSS